MRLHTWIQTNKGRAIARDNYRKGAQRERDKAQSYMESVPMLRQRAQDRVEKARRELAEAEFALSSVEAIQQTFADKAHVRARQFEQDAAALAPLPIPPRYVLPLSWVLQCASEGTRPTYEGALKAGHAISQRELSDAIDCALELGWVLYSGGNWYVPENSALPALLEAA